MLGRYKWIGTLAFFVTLPGLYFYLQREERTRVVVRVGDEILLLKGWYGPNKWMLPGGGMHSSEQPAEAAVRELAEETGMRISTGQLEYIDSGHVTDSYGLRYKYHLFVLELASKPAVDISNMEICDSSWQDFKQSSTDAKGVLKATRTTLGVWMKHQNLL